MQRKSPYAATLLVEARGQARSGAVRRGQERVLGVQLEIWSDWSATAQTECFLPASSRCPFAISQYYLCIVHRAAVECQRHVVGQLRSTQCDTY